MEKSLDRKLRSIHADPQGSREFILADAKDADMALAIGAPGRSPEQHAGEVRLRSMHEYREMIRQIVGQELVDIMLMSASTSEVLTIHERLFDGSPVTPAARVNDTTDIHILRGGKYTSHASLPFRTATLDHIQCGHVDCAPDERSRGANLGLYSMTFNNDTVPDRQSLEAFKAFRLEAERAGFRYFLEVFDPNVPDAVAADVLPGFINDAIVRSLAGVTQAGRPVFLKMVYHGPRAIEELINYDPHIVIGILGGSAGTTYDAFKLIHEAQKYGARAALFGRKINNAESQLAFVRFLRLIVDGVIGPEEAVRAYHAVLEKLGIRAQRPLEDDLRLETNVMSYGGDGRKMSVAVSTPGAAARGLRGSATPAAAAVRSASQAVAGSRKPAGACACGPSCGCQGAPDGRTASLANRAAPGATARGSTATSSAAAYPVLSTGAPDFSQMTSEQRVAYHRARLGRLLGERPRTGS